MKYIHKVTQTERYKRRAPKIKNKCIKENEVMH